MNSKKHPMTFLELKQQLEALSPAQLATEVVWSGDDHGGRVRRLWIAEEDWIGTCDGDCEPRSAVAARDPDAVTRARVIIARGTPQLLVD